MLGLVLWMIDSQVLVCFCNVCLFRLKSVVGLLFPDL